MVYDYNYQSIGTTGDRSVKSLVEFDGKLWAGVGTIASPYYPSMYYSTDFTTWTKDYDFTSEVAGFIQTTCIHGSELYAVVQIYGTNTCKLFKRTGVGAWSQVDTGTSLTSLGCGNIKKIVSYDGDLYVTGAKAATQDVVWKSTDNGVNWALDYTSSNYYRGEDLIEWNGDLYLSALRITGQYHQVARKSGGSWSAGYIDGVTLQRSAGFVIDPINDKLYYAGWNSGSSYKIYNTTDGSSWSLVATVAAPTDNSIPAFWYSSDGRINIITSNSGSDRRIAYATDGVTFTNYSLIEANSNPTVAARQYVEYNSTPCLAAYWDTGAASPGGVYYSKTSFITADFSGTPLSGKAPLTVNFTDASSPTPDSWAWDFGDSGTSTDENPTHIYTTSGRFTVELESTLGVTTDTESKVDYVEVSEDIDDTLHMKALVFGVAEAEGLDAYAVEFLKTEKVVVADADYSDAETEIKQSDALLIDASVSIGDQIGRCYSANSITLRWRYPVGITKANYRHLIYRKKKGFTLQAKHSNGTFKALVDDQVAVKVYDEELTAGEYVDTYKLEDGQQYFYTSFLVDINTGYAYADALNANPVSTVAVINRSNNWTANKCFQLIPHQWATKDDYGTHAALMDVMSWRNDLMEDYINHFKMWDSDKTLGEIIPYTAAQFSGIEKQQVLGIDTLRRQIGMSQLATQWKGSKRGIIKLIRWLTTWQIGSGHIYTREEQTSEDWFETYDVGFNKSVLWSDDVVLDTEAYGYGDAYNEIAYRLYGPTEIGDLGTTAEVELFIEIPNVALAIGNSTSMTYDSSYQATIFQDDNVNFSLTNTIGAYLVPNQNSFKDYFTVITQSPNRIYVKERITAAKSGDNYCVVTPLDLLRLKALEEVIPLLVPFWVKCYFRMI